MRVLTRTAQVANQIKKTLKENFPSIKFKIRSDKSGNSCDVSWTDGPTTREVNALTCQHKYGCFGSAQENNSIPQVRYLFLQRKMSDETLQSLTKKYPFDFGGEDLCFKYTFYYRKFEESSLFKKG